MELFSEWPFYHGYDFPKVSQKSHVNINDYYNVQLRGRIWPVCVCGGGGGGRQYRIAISVVFALLYNALIYSKLDIVAFPDTPLNFVCIQATSPHNTDEVHHPSLIVLLRCWAHACMSASGIPCGSNNTGQHVVRYQTNSPKYHRPPVFVK